LKLQLKGCTDVINGWTDPSTLGNQFKFIDELSDARCSLVRKHEAGKPLARGLPCVR
jgi:hypothetical protein